MAILQLVDQLADMLNQGWHIPLSPYRVIRARDFEHLIERMRINVPSSIRESERTIAERDRIIDEARMEADRILQQAKQQAMEMLSERSLVTTAQQEAERIVEESRELARRRAEEADIYAVQVLQNVAQRLQSLMQQVDNGIEVMQEGREWSGEQPREDSAQKRPPPKPKG